MWFATGLTIATQRHLASTEVVQIGQLKRSEVLIFEAKYFANAIVSNNIQALWCNNSIFHGNYVLLNFFSACISIEWIERKLRRRNTPFICVIRKKNCYPLLAVVVVLLRALWVYFIFFLVFDYANFNGGLLRSNCVHVSSNCRGKWHWVRCRWFALPFFLFKWNDHYNAKRIVMHDPDIIW